MVKVDKMPCQKHAIGWTAFGVGVIFFLCMQGTTQHRTEMATLQDKIKVSAGSAAAMTALSLPIVYQITNRFLGGLIGPLYANGCPTMLGLAIHAAVFYFYTKWTMRGYGDEAAKRRRSLIAAGLFVAIQHPATYKLVRRVLGSGVATSAGCPKPFGFIAHAAVYTAVLVWMMKF